MTTLSDVARAAGVSISVASRVLNSDASLRARPDTRKRVLRYAAKLDYRPNHAARSLRLSQSRTVGLFMPDVTNPIVAEVLRGVEDGANDSDVQVVLGRIERIEHSGEGLRRLVGEGRVDGLLVQLSDGLPVDEFEQVTTDTTPVVLLHSHGTRPGSIVLDDVTGAALATRHLLDLGHREIGFIGGLTASESGSRRRRGYLTAMREADLRPRPRWMTARGYTAEQGREAARSVLTTGRTRPTALVVANLNAAAGVMAIAHELGLTIPQNLSVVAIHDTWVADYLHPTLTTIRMPLYQLGREGLAMLTAVLAGGARRDQAISDPEPDLMVRGSSAPPTG